MDTGPYALMADLLDSVNVGLCLFDDGDHALLWNRTFLALFPEHDGHIRVGEHYSANLRRFYMGRLDADELPMIDRYIAEGIARHRSQSQPFVFVHRGQWVRVASLPIGAQGRIRVWTPLASPSGGTQWERPTGGQAASPEDAFMEHVADGVMLLDSQGVITAVNEPILFLYGLPHKADAVGLRYEELLSQVWNGDSSRLSATLVERQRFPGAPFEVELPHNRWLRVVEQRGVEGRAYSSHVDITEMKRLQNAANAAREEADRANAAKSHFLAMISHEIRTPMNAIIGIGRIALKSALEPAQRGYLETINNSAGRLLGIINDLLDFSKIEAGKVQIAAQPFDLDEALEPLCDLILGNTVTDQVEVMIRVKPGTPDRLVGDPLRLSQILANLTSNALKFTERGDILIEVEETARSGDRVGLRFSVTDTGIGVDPAQQATLFQPFVQADDSTTRRYGGTGLGLSICKQLVDLMGGAIALSSTPGQGSRFSFEVTLGVAQSPTPPDPDRTATRVLVVDDHPTARAALAEMVGALGYQVVVANSGPAALLAVDQAARQNAPIHAVLLDWAMPGWDGALTAERLRTSRRAAGVPVIPMIAATARHSAFRPAQSGGQTDVLFKPVAPGRLRARLAGILRPQNDQTPNSPTPDAPTRRPDLSRLNGARVLLVDDNALNREVALHLLAEAKVTVDVAEDGVQAVERVCSGDYDLVLMDIQMPEMDGLEATRRIRQMERHRHLPIVAMTAHAMSDHRRASHQAGMNDHLTKPIDPDLLHDTMIRLIDPTRLAGRQTFGAAPPPAREPARAPNDAPNDAAHAQPPTPDVGASARQAGLDWDAALRRVDGDVATLQKLIRSFCKNTASYAQELKAAAAADETERIRFLSHALRSSAAYIGAMALSALAGRTDETARAGNRPLANGLACELAAELDQVLAALPTLFAAPAPMENVSGGNLEPAIRHLADRLENADLRAEEAWSNMSKLLTPAHRDFAETFSPLLDDLRYAEALDHLRRFAANQGVDLLSHAASDGDHPS
jgi:two-component system, sensor histidine kinase and response regulator